MLREILEQAILSDPDMEVISEPVMAAPTEDQLRPPDVVVAGISDAEPAASARELLARWPHSHLLIITARGHRVFRYEPRPRGVDLGEMSPAQLVDAIRAAVRREQRPYAH